MHEIGVYIKEPVIIEKAGRLQGALYFVLPSNEKTNLIVSKEWHHKFKKWHNFKCNKRTWGNW